MSSDPTAGNSVAERIKQIHTACLDAEYAVEYYKAFHSNTVRYASHFDFVIALGAATSGGSGLVGILAKMPNVGWICGVLTIASVVLSTAKSNYNWADKTKFAVTSIGFYDGLFNSLRYLVEDLNYAHDYNDEFEKRYQHLRNEKAKAPQDFNKSLPLAIQREIQARIRDRSDLKTWWRPAG